MKSNETYKKAVGGEIFSSETMALMQSKDVGLRGNIGM